MDTVPASYCQVRHLSSYGCAAPARNAIGFDSAFTRRFEPGLPRFPALMFACSVVYASRTFLMSCCAACAPRPRDRSSAYVYFRSSYSRGTPRSNATCDTQFGASDLWGRVGGSAATCSAVGSTFTRPTTLTLRNVLLGTDNRPD